MGKGIDLARAASPAVATTFGTSEPVGPCAMCQKRLQPCDYSCVAVAQALSASPLSHAERPSFPAFFRYAAFSAFVQRIWICSLARSLADMGGLPLGRLSMGELSPTQIILAIPPDL